MDYSKVNDFVDTRESNFLSNPKSWRQDDSEYPFATVATTAITSNNQGTNATIYAQVSQRAEIVAQRAWEISSLVDSDRLDAYVASLLMTSEIESAELVLVNPDLLFKNGFFASMTSRLKRYYQHQLNKSLRRFYNHEQTKSENISAATPVIGSIEKEVMEIYRLLGWCWEEAMKDTVSRTFASHSCFGRGRPTDDWV
jgi:hypothetical protein